MFDLSAADWTAIHLSLKVATVATLVATPLGIAIAWLLAGAGIAGLVLGLALQDTLSNIFSGFAIYFGGQFKTGDWLQIGERHAEITEFNWRSTRLRRDGSMADTHQDGALCAQVLDGGNLLPLSSPDNEGQLK